MEWAPDISPFEAPGNPIPNLLELTPSEALEPFPAAQKGFLVRFLDRFPDRLLERLQDSFLEKFYGVIMFVSLLLYLMKMSPTPHRKRSWSLWR
jgi:hypothetical protein